MIFSEPVELNRIIKLILTLSVVFLVFLYLHVLTSLQFTAMAAAKLPRGQPSWPRPCHGNRLPILSIWATAQSLSFLGGNPFGLGFAVAARVFTSLNATTTSLSFLGGNPFGLGFIVALKVKS